MTKKIRSSQEGYTSIRLDLKSTAGEVTAATSQHIFRTVPGVISEPTRTEPMTTVAELEPDEVPDEGHLWRRASSVC